jgi:ribosome-binding factor A
MFGRRVFRLNSLLREVISEVLSFDIHHRSSSVTVTYVEITRDLSYAKVFFTLLGEKEKREEMKKQLDTLAPKIQAIAMKKVVMRIFPKLEFFYDEGLEKQLRIHELLAKSPPHQPDSSLT